MYDVAQCNLVDLPFDYDWDHDLKYLNLIRGTQDDICLREIHIEFAKAIVVFGDKRYRQAWREFAPDSHEKDPTPISLWDEGVKELVTYIMAVKRKVEIDEKKPKNSPRPMHEYLPNHDFENDSAYQVLSRHMPIQTVSIAKSAAMINNDKEAVRVACPWAADSNLEVERLLALFYRQERAMALLAYLKALYRAERREKTKPPGGVPDMIADLLKDYATTTNIDIKIRIMRGIHQVQGGSKGAEPDGMPEDMDWDKLGAE